MATMTAASFAGNRHLFHNSLTLFVDILMHRLNNIFGAGILRYLLFIDFDELKNPIHVTGCEQLSVGVYGIFYISLTILLYAVITVLKVIWF